MIRIALVGNIASGKSEAEKIISEFGYKVLDTDNVAHSLLENNEDVIKAFAGFDIFENGNISREKLGKLVFGDNEKKQLLENILYPQIRNKIIDFFKQNSNEKFLFVSIPLLFESNMTDLFDKIIFIYADDEIRLKRLMSRNNYTKEYAQVRMSAQISQDEKAKKADVVIFNNSTLEKFHQDIKSQLLVL